MFGPRHNDLQKQVNLKIVANTLKTILRFPGFMTYKLLDIRLFFPGEHNYNIM